MFRILCVVVLSMQSLRAQAPCKHHNQCVLGFFNVDAVAPLTLRLQVGVYDLAERWKDSHIWDRSSV